jgi:cytochrome c
MNDHKTAGYAVIFLLLMTSAVPAADLAHGRDIFRTCASCHSIDGDHSGFGPTLKNIVGRHAASVADYTYSPAMRAAGSNGLIWDEQTLAEFLKSPQTKVPGTKMRFWGLWQREVGDLIAFLKSTATSP